jgi:hypothetical protein
MGEIWPAVTRDAKRDTAAEGEVLCLLGSSFKPFTLLTALGLLLLLLFAPTLPFLAPFFNAILERK